MAGDGKVIACRLGSSPRHLDDRPFFTWRSVWAYVLLRSVNLGASVSPI